MFRAVVVSPQRLTAANGPAQYQTRNGPVAHIAGPGYRGQAQNDSSSTQEAGLEQSNAQIVSGKVIVRLLVTYNGTGLRGVPQLREVATLGDYVGRRLARHP